MIPKADCRKKHSMCAAKGRLWPALLAMAFAAVPGQQFGHGSSERSGTNNSQTAPAAQSAEATQGDLTGQAQVLFRRAADLIDKNQFSAAVQLLQDTLKLAPDSPSAHHYLGYALWKENQWGAAAREFQTAHALDPRNAYTLYFLGNIAQSTGNIADAIRYYEAELALDKPLFDTYQILGQAYFVRGETRKARAMIEQAIQLFPWDGSLHYQLAKIAKRTGRLSEAQQELETSERLKKIDRASIKKLLELSVAIQEGRTDRVSSIRQELVAQTPSDAETLQTLGLLLGRGSYYLDALEPLEQAAQMLPDSYEPHYNLGLTQLKLGRDGAAETALKRAVELRPDSFESNSTLAVLYVSQNRNREAIERLRAALQARPEDEKILALLGDQYLLADEAAAAVPALREAIRLKPDKPETRHLLIQAYQHEKDFTSALIAAQEGAKLFPSDGRFQYDIGSQLANLGRYGDALAYAEKSVRLDPSLVEGHDLVGDLKYRRGEYDQALASFQRAKSLDATDLEAFRGIGQTLIRLKRYSEAVIELNSALLVHPDVSEFYHDLSQAYIRLGDREKAAQASAKFQQLHSIEVSKRDLEDWRRATQEAGTLDKE